ncbi:uncharacterized protein LOC144162784 isoform X1 [Haemaphysalis longicornis]
MSPPKRRCAVLGCKASEGPDTQVLYSLPNDSERRQAWLLRIGLSVTDKRKSVYVCGRHFAAEAYQGSPELVKSMGFASRVLLRPTAMPTLHLPPVPAPTMQRPSTSATPGITSPEPMPTPPACQCACHPPLHTTATQTAVFQWEASTQTEQQGSTKNNATQVNLEAKVRVAVGTQTDECPSFLARKEAQTADASPLPVPPDFQPERQSTPLPADAMELGEDQLPEVERSLTDDITMEVDEQEPGAESDATFHLTAELSFASDQAEQTPQDQRKFLVFERELLAVCRICHKPCQNDFKVLGSMVRVNSKCPDPTCPGTTWQSQPLLGDKAAGNVLLAAAILFSGCPVAASLRALQSIKIQTITERTYFNYQRGYLLPAVKKLYQEQQDQLVRRVAGTAVDLAGDGRCDSPGYSAKYCTYSLLCTQLNRIIHCEQIRVKESASVPNSVAMEKEGLVRSMVKLEEQGVAIRSLTTDRHPAIRTLCRQKKPNTRHFFDVWHIAKGLKKKLKLAAKSKGCSSIQLWIEAIKNHLYWTAAMGDGDGELILSIWGSLLNHVCNKHVGHQGPFSECLHEPLEDRQWMRPDSPAFLKLRAILQNPRLLSDLQQLSPTVQTYALESFNSLIIRFAPKAIAFSEEGMAARTQLAVLHYNENALRPQAKTKKGKKKYKVKMSRPRPGHFFLH